jgi:hypothetical protein
MPALRWAALFIICVALSGCCTFGEMCSGMAPPTSGPAMAWDGAGQPPDRKVAQVRHPHHREAEIVTGSLNPVQADPLAQADLAANAGGAPPDVMAAAETELRQKLVICRGCLSAPPAAPAETARSDRQMTAFANP